jgi:(p)ppGpp synthase/HD superfamily hydrolase
MAVILPLDRAPLTAQHYHAGQLYDGLDYVEAHVSKVVNILFDAGVNDEDIKIAAWLHDTLEDTSYTALQLEKDYGPAVRDLVFACSGFGPSRKARNADIYAKLEQTPRACIVKIADRIANLESAIEGNKQSYAAMYVKENDAFYNVVADHIPDNLRQRYFRAITDAVKLLPT